MLFSTVVPAHLQNSPLFLAFEWKSLLLPILWFSVFVLTLIIESQTADLVSIWFAPGAFVAMILAFCNVSVAIQIIVFVSITVVGLLLAFTILRPRMKAKNQIVKTNADSLEGKLAIVEEDIDNAMATGVVKVNGQLWTARMIDPASKPIKGEWVEIVRVEGAKLICRLQH